MENHLPLVALYDLFFTKKLREVHRIDKQQTLTPLTPPRKALDPSILTPVTKSIYTSLNEYEKKLFLNEIQKDDNILKDLEALQNLDDEEYKEKLENNGLGFYMEDYICANCVCPLCHQPTLRKYAIKNMPIVDIICINKDFHIKQDPPLPFLFQVKIKVQSSYFDKKTKLISVGSKRIGYLSHQISGNSPIENKLVLMSYICLSMNRIDDVTYKINLEDSFCLIPNLSFNSSSDYYNYISNDKRYKNKFLITWNEQAVKLLEVKSLFAGSLSRVDTMIVFYEIEIPNPYENIPEIVFKNEWRTYKRPSTAKKLIFTE